MTTQLPVARSLESLRIATPCTADWDDMVAASDGDRVRFCGKCEKSVYNLSEMTRAEGEALIAAREGRLCLRLFRREDGTVLTSDCPDGMRRVRFRARVWTRLSKLAVSAGLLVGLGLGRARADLAVDPKTKTAAKAPPIVDQGQPVMGAEAAEPRRQPEPKPAKPGKAAKAKPAPQPPKPRLEPFMGDISE